MAFTIIDLPPDENHLCDELPDAYNYPRGTVIECDCGQRYLRTKFFTWDKTDWKRPDER